MQLPTTYYRRTDQERRNRIKYCLFFIAFCMLTFSSCEDSFQPLQENNKYYFSIYGTLDAAKDTQWVRVGPARQDINEPPDPSRIQVTLKDLQSGKTVVMQDSLFVSGNVLNYWTTMPLEYEHTYQIHAERDDEKSSKVTITMPKELPTPLVTQNTFAPLGFNIYIDHSVEHVADLQSKWYVLLYPQTQRLKKIYTFTYRNTIIQTGVYGGAWYAFAPTTEELRYITNNTNADFAVLHRQFFVAAGGPEWIDDISSVDDLEYFLDGTASNVENGLGYVVGTDSKWVPYKTCVTPDSSYVIPCEPEEPFW